MRILVISDSHGCNDDVAGVISQVGKIDMLIHCGDVERDEERIHAMAGCPVHMVGGNCDFNLDLPREEAFMIGEYRVLLVHGHMHRVNRGVDYLRKIALREGYHIVMFGHTHRPFIDIGDDVTILNPGSLSYPRQKDRRPTFLLMELDEDGIAHYGHGYYQGRFADGMI